ncbi:MAG TPA: PaaI family thioesterase [Methylomirabilota bacterium]
MPTDLLSVTRERAQDNLFWRYIGVIVDDAGEGWVRLRVPVKDGLRNAAGAPVHGGVLSALVDMAIGGALGTTHDNAGGGVGQTTLDMNVSFLSAAGDGELVAEGRLLRRGRTIAFGEARISDGAGKLVAVGRATYMLLQPKS